MMPGDEKFQVIETWYPGRVCVRQEIPALGLVYKEQAAALINRVEDELFVLQREAMLIGAVRNNPYVFAPRWQKPFLWLLDRIGGV